MADVNITLSDALCFVRHKFDKVAVKQLKSVLIDFYSAEVLSEAKSLLLNDIHDFNSFGLPHIPRRREGENRAAREVDDIMAIFTRLDELKQLDQLPRYVADGPETMPSLRLYEGDLKGIMKMMQKLHDTVMEQGAALSAMTRELHLLQACRELSSTTQSSSTRRPDNLSAESGQRSKQNTMTSEGIPSRDIDGAWAAVHSDQPLRGSGDPDWATIASSSLLIHSNRFAALMSVDAERSDDRVSEQQFTTVKSRRPKRPRNSTPTDSGSTQQQPQPQPQIQRRAPLIVGKAPGAIAGPKLSAAMKIPKKCVFYIDNVSPSCSVDDIKSFVTSLLAKVETCFEVRPRRRREDGDEPIVNRKAFRLCVREEFRDQLLKASLWPDSVSVSDWFFKPSASRDNNLDNRRQDDTVRDRDAAHDNRTTCKSPPQATDAEVHVGDSAIASVAAAAAEETISDDTILAAYDADNNAANMDYSVTVSDGSRL